MRRRLQAALERLRGAGVLGIGVLVASAAYYVSALAPAQQRLAAQREAQAQLRGLHGPAASAAGRARELDAFYAQFPPVTALGEQLERVHQLARASGLELAQGEYRLERPVAGLWLYRMSLPVRGSYAQVRDFIAAPMREMPVVSLDALRFERKRAAEPQLEAQLRFTLYVRPTGDSP